MKSRSRSGGARGNKNRRPQNRAPRRRRSCRFTEAGVSVIDYKDIGTLQDFMTDAGKIVPARVTGTKSRFQRQLTTAIKRARYIALLPYTDRH